MDGINDFEPLTLREVAELLKVSKAHISNIVAGRVPGCAPIPTVSLGRRKLVRRAALLAWVHENERTASLGIIPVSPVRGVRKRA